MSAWSRRSFARLAVVGALGLAPVGVAAPAAADEPAPGETEGAPRPAAPPKLADPSTKRFTLETASYTDSDHVTVFTPSITADVENVTQGASLRASYLVDVVSAASVDIVSTASRRWHEVRQAGAVEAEYKPHDFGVIVGASTSSEPDYLSYGVGITALRDFDEKNTTLLLGYGFAHDVSGRAGTPFSVFSRTIDHSTLNAGVTQLLDRATVLSVAGDLVLDNGDPSKPYRYVPMFAPGVAPAVPSGASIDYVTAHRLPERPLEQLPLTRQRFALTGRLGRRFQGSTARLEQRLYLDSWGMAASTSDVRWIFDLGPRVTIWPHLRAHVQSRVDFWKRAYVSNGASGTWDLPELRTGDRELGPLRTTTAGGGARWSFGGEADREAWSLALQIDAMHTAFLDDLYITSRVGFIGTLTLGGEL